MANLGQTYDASGGETMREGGPIPAGEYVAVINRSDVRGPNDKGNSSLELEFTITEGQFEGRKFWANINLWNSNPTAVEIAQRELNTICHACGKLRIQDSEELHGIPMQVRLGFRKDDKERNEPKGYKPLNAAPSGRPAAPSAPTPSAPSGGGNAPWRKSA